MSEGEIARLREDLKTKNEEIRILLSGTVEGELRLQLASMRQEIDRLTRERHASFAAVNEAQLKALTAINDYYSKR